MKVLRSWLPVLFVVAACTPSAPPAPVPARAPEFVDAVIPRPASMQLDPSRMFRVDTATTIYVDQAADSTTLAVGNYLRTMLTPIVGHDVQRTSTASTLAPNRIRLSIDPASTAGSEGYTLDVSPDAISIVAKTPAGLFYGIQTLRQLMPVSVENVAAVGRILTVPSAHIVDSPRYEWRGMMIDVSRHFLPPRDVKRFIDLLALYKVNRLHLHLSDDQGWRIEIKSRPNLTSVGGLTQVGGAAGGFFTQDEYRDIVAYAAARFMTVVPEIDMPAHLNAALVSYPEMTCDHIAPPPFTFIGAPRNTVLCVDSANVYPIIEDIVREISSMTPGPYYHIGGDEVPRLTPEQYHTFIERMQSIVNANGKIMIGWADIAPANLSPSTIVQSWHNDPPELQTARGGKVIMSPGQKAYLDMKYDSTTILGLKWGGFITPQVAYDWDPATYKPGISESSILGVEYPLWAETVVRAEDYEFMAFPRIMAMAEIGWTPQTRRTWTDFDKRLQYSRKRLTALGVNAGY